MGDGRDRFAEQTLRSRRRARGGAITDGDIAASGPQVDHPVVRRDPHIDFGMALLESAQTRHDPQARDADAGGNRHWLAVAPGGERIDAILELLKGAVGNPKETLAFGGEADRAVAAVEQSGAERLLERDNLAADRGLGEEKILRRERNAHAAAHGDETANKIERR